MKKVKIMVIAVLIVCLATLGLSSCNLFRKDEDEKKPFVIGVISDCQIVAESDVGDDGYLSFQDLNEVGQKMLFVSEAILKTAVDRLIEEKVDVVLLPGDMTENGSEVGHETVARECKRLLDAGIPAYVVCGNHDINKNPEKFYGSVQDALTDGNYETKAEAERNGYTNDSHYIEEVFADGSCSVAASGVSPERFMEIYNEFGFKDAIARDRLDAPVRNYVEEEDYEFYEVGTMSYVQDLVGSDYRLICVDAANYYENERGSTYYMARYGEEEEYQINGTGYSVMTDRLFDWTETQVKAAVGAGKKPILMLHFPVNGQMGDIIDHIDIGDNKLNMQREFQAMLTENGVEYVFTGHLHCQHTATYTDEDTGNTLTDIETGCLTNYALPIRYVTTDVDGSVSIRNEYLSAVKAEYVPSYVDEATKTKITTDLQRYAVDFVYNNLLTNFDNRIHDDDEEYALFYNVFEMLGLDEEEERGGNEKLKALAEYVYNDVYKAFLQMPINDKGDGSVSVEGLCKNYVSDFPKTEYKDVFGFVCEVIGKVYKYDYTVDSPVTYDSADGKLLRYAIYSAFEYLRVCDLFPMLHEIKESIPADVVSTAFVEKLFKQGTIDLMAGDFLLKAVDIVKGILPSSVTTIIDPDKLDVDLLVKSVIPLVNTLYPNLVALANNFLPALCDVEAKTICGVSVDDMLKIAVEKSGEKDVAVLEIYIDSIFEKLVFGAIGKDLLY